MLLLKDRFRGYCPIVIDVETGGLDPTRHALLECAAVSVRFSDEGLLVPDQTAHWHIEPAENTQLDPKALAFNKIDPTHPFRGAVPESLCLAELFAFVHALLKAEKCHRAVLVGHNAWFDLHFLQAAVQRQKIKNNPFHAFTSLDTASLGAVFFGQTVLAKLLLRAKIPYNPEEAHSALYDAQCTAALFTYFVNQLSIGENIHGSPESLL